MNIIGIDTGKNGAIAVVGNHIDVIDIPTYKSRVEELAYVDFEVDKFIKDYKPEIVLIERVHSYPKQGVASTFKFGVTYGYIVGKIHSLGCAIIFVTPRLWQSVLEGEGPTKDKSLYTARKNYPSLEGKLTRKKDHNRADAINIAHYGLTKYGE